MMQHMTPGWIFLLPLVLLTAIAIRSLQVLQSGSPWTSGGWALTIAYDLAESVEVAGTRHLPFHLPYLILAAMTLAFVVAGVRDEPQATPWWNPKKLTLTRAQKRA